VVGATVVVVVAAAVEEEEGVVVTVDERVADVAVLVVEAAASHCSALGATAVVSMVLELSQGAVQERQL
jgi:hypothetical protein